MRVNYEATQAVSQQSRSQEIHSQATQLKEEFDSGLQGAGWWDENTSSIIHARIDQLIEDTKTPGSDQAELENEWQVIQGWFAEHETAPLDEDSYSEQ